MKNKDWQTLSAKLFCIIVCILGTYLLLKYLLPVLSPLLIAFVTAFAVSSISKKINKKTGIPKGICAFFTVSLLLILLGTVVIFALRHLISEARRVVDILSVGNTDIPIWLSKRIESIPLLKRFAQGSEAFADGLAPLAAKAMSALVSHLGTILGNIIRSTPSTFVGGIVTVLCIYYASIDFDGITGGIMTLLPISIRTRLSQLRVSGTRIIRSYLRAYAILFVLTFGEIFVGLLILCPSFSFLGALIIAAIDILPVFGAGFILIPWSILSLFSGKTFMGIGLLVLYVTVTVIRQIAEPRILSGSIGIHPLLTLVGMFLGYRLVGFIGMITAPIALCIAMGAVKQYSLSNGKATVNSDKLPRDK